MSANDFDSDDADASSSSSSSSSPGASSHPTDAPGAATDDTDGEDDADLELAAQVELLADENRRLREEYVRARQSRYRATAIGLAAIGVVAALGGVLFPDSREVLVALGATGLFGALLTYYLTPSQFVAADVGERVYAAASTNLAAIRSELGLRDERIYVPAETDPARLYVPQRAEFAIPDPGSGPIVVDDDSRGLLLAATGGELFLEFRRSLTGELAAAPAALAGQLTDALVEQFELVRSADADVDPDGGRATVAVTGSAFGDVDRFDHPISSFLAVGFAAGLDRPVTLETTPGDDRADWLITCTWEHDGDASDAEAAAADGTDTETVRFEES